MKLKFTHESQVLDAKFREAVIKEVVYGAENIDRKAAALRRHEVYRDQNKKWVMVGVTREGYKPSTVQQIANRATNISIMRKIVDKKAVTYIGGVERTVGEPVIVEGKKVPSPDQKSIEMLVDELDFNTYMKKSDRYREGQKNCLVGILPVLNSRETRDNNTPKFDLAMKVLAPWEYDIIEDPHDKTKPAVVLITDFPERREFQSDANYNDGAKGIVRASSVTGISDGRDQVIADSPEDMGQDPSERTIIWWTDSYHFTTNLKGEILPQLSPSESQNLNPIRLMPWVDISGDKDGNYWARGGEDLVDGSILINKKLTDTNFIAYMQGWGQLVIAATQIPKKLEGGPDNAFIFEKQDGAETVQVEFVSSNPPIDSWLELVRTTLALLLSTNNLSVNAIAAKLDAQSAESGISKAIDNAEVLVDLKDVQELYRDKEPEIWEIVRLWHSLYHSGNWLTKRFQAITPFTDSNVSLTFFELRAPITEREKLEALKLRKDLGIATLKDLIRRDNPDMSEAEVDAKVEELEGDQAKKSEETARMMRGQMARINGAEPGTGDGDSPAEGDEEEADEEEGEEPA